jgi:hypothetical protein
LPRRPQHRNSQQFFGFYRTSRVGTIVSMAELDIIDWYSQNFLHAWSSPSFMCEKSEIGRRSRMSDVPTVASSSIRNFAETCSTVLRTFFVQASLAHSARDGADFINLQDGKSGHSAAELIRITGLQVSSLAGHNGPSPPRLMLGSDNVCAPTCMESRNYLQAPEEIEIRRISTQSPSCNCPFPVLHVRRTS